MYSLTVLYPNQPGARFDLDYYIDTHMRLVQDRLGPGGMIRFELAKGVAGWPAETEASHVMICMMYFNGRDEVVDAFSAHCDELIADIQMYTNIKPRMQICEILD